MHKNKLWQEKTLNRTTSLDSLANSSSNHSESLSDESHDSDSGADTKSKKFDHYGEASGPNLFGGSLRSWTKSESTSSTSDSSYDYLTNNDNDIVNRNKIYDRMETIPEEGEPKVSVKEILARFENLKDDKKMKIKIKPVNVQKESNHNLSNSGVSVKPKQPQQPQQQQEVKPHSSAHKELVVEDKVVEAPIEVN